MPLQRQQQAGCMNKAAFVATTKMPKANIRILTCCLPLGCLPLQASPRCVSVVEVNSETDFVGRSEPFQQLVKAAAAAAAALLPQQPPVAAVQLQQLGFEQLSSARLDASGATVAEGCASLAGKVRENIALRRGWIMAGGPNSEYAATAAVAAAAATFVAAWY
jgi:translation elongation factor EF-Ts